MSAPWDPIARHGDSEAKVRAAFEELNAAALHQLRLELRAEEMPLRLIEKALAVVAEHAAKQLDQDVPNIMRRMAVSAGALSVH